MYYNRHLYKEQHTVLRPVDLGHVPSIQKYLAAGIHREEPVRHSLAVRSKVSCHVHQFILDPLQSKADNEPLYKRALKTKSRTAVCRR